MRMALLTRRNRVIKASAGDADPQGVVIGAIYLAYNKCNSIW